MKTESLLGAAMVGILVLVLYEIVDVALAINSPDFQGLATSIDCIIISGTGMMVGLIFSWLQGREGGLTTGAGAKGGAAAGAIAFGVYALFVMIVTALVWPLLLEVMLNNSGVAPGTEVDMDLVGSIMSVSLLVSICGLALVGVVISTAGGVIGSAVVGKQ